jgi:hypothetical protein
MRHDGLTETDRRRAAEAAIASVALDGLQISQHTRELLEEAVRGAITTQQLYQQVLDHTRGDRS